MIKIPDYPIYLVDETGVYRRSWQKTIPVAKGPDGLYRLNYQGKISRFSLEELQRKTGQYKIISKPEPKPEKAHNPLQDLPLEERVKIRTEFFTGIPFQSLYEKYNVSPAIMRDFLGIPA